MNDDPMRSAGGKLGEYVSYGARDNRERPMSEVLKDIIGNVQEMVRSEVRLATAELREEAHKTGSAMKLIGIGAGLGLFAGAFLLTTVALLLSLVMPAWLATLILGAVLGIGAYVMLNKGMTNLTMPKPQKTIDNVKENVEWVKNQTR